MSWCREDSFLKHMPYIGKQGPLWHTVRRRIVTELDTNLVLYDETIQPQL